MVKLAFETTFKLMLAGDERSGKDKIAENYAKGVFNPAQKITIGVEFLVKDLVLEGKHLVMFHFFRSFNPIFTISNF